MLNSPIITIGSDKTLDIQDLTHDHYPGATCCIAVADAGFLEGVFCYSNVRKIFRPRPLSVETTPIFESF